MFILVVVIAQNSISLKLNFDRFLLCFASFLSFAEMTFICDVFGCFNFDFYKFNLLYCLPHAFLIILNRYNLVCNLICRDVDADAEKK